MFIKNLSAFLDRHPIFQTCIYSPSHMTTSIFSVDLPSSIIISGQQHTHLQHHISIKLIFLSTFVMYGICFFHCTLFVIVEDLLWKNTSYPQAISYTEPFTDSSDLLALFWPWIPDTGRRVGLHPCHDPVVCLKCAFRFFGMFLLLQGEVPVERLTTSLYYYIEVSGGRHRWLSKVRWKCRKIILVRELRVWLIPYRCAETELLTDVTASFWPEHPSKRWVALINI